MNDGGDWLTMQYHAHNARIPWDIRSIMQGGLEETKRKKKPTFTHGVFIPLHRTRDAESTGL